MDAPLLLPGHGVGRSPVARAAAALHLDEAEDAPILGDEIELARPRPEIAREDPVALRLERFLGDALPVVSGSPGAAGPGAAPRKGAEETMEKACRGQRRF